MQKINVNLKERSYPICIGASLSSLGAELKKLGLKDKVFVVTNPKIKKLYYAKVLSGLKKSGFEAVCVAIPDGEKYKTLDTVKYLYEQALKAGLDRKSVVVALGGGVVGDVAGYFAATYMRGLAFVQVPTTLLAMVDSSVGGKTGVDLPEGKNLVGCFYQPKLVWIDVSVLKTLPERHIKNGLAEVIKYGIISDANFFKYLEGVLKKGAKLPDFVKIIARSCEIKAGVVEKDEFERKGLREVLNLGHTYGHAIETLSGYNTYLHGEAVAIGMNLASKLAENLKILKSADSKRIAALIGLAGLPTKTAKAAAFNKVEQVMKRDKKSLNGNIKMVLPVSIGKTKIYANISRVSIKKAVEELK